MTTTTAFFNALIDRFRASVPTGAKSAEVQTVHIRTRPMADSVQVPAYRRRGLASRSARSLYEPSSERGTWRLGAV